MPTPPTPALLLSLPPNTLCGINLLTFTTTNAFHGLKNIPPGWHFLYTSATVSLSVRLGYWVYIHPTKPFFAAFTWDPESESLLPILDPTLLNLENARVPEVWERGLSPYRQSAAAGADEEGRWEQLTQHITPQLLTRLLGKEWAISSTSCAPQDRDDIPGLSAAESAIAPDRELGVLGIDLKRTWREGAIGRERTEGAVDRSWALEQIVVRWGGDWDVVLGEMEVCFLMVLTTGNWSCLQEWKRCVELALTCRRLVREREKWFEELVPLVRRQLERGEDVEGGLFDMSDEGAGWLKELLRGFRRIVEEMFGKGEGEDVKEELKGLEVWLRSEYGWELSDDFVRRGMLELEDGEMVEMDMEDMEGEDERGEYAPVIVDFGASELAT